MVLELTPSACGEKVSNQRVSEEGVCCNLVEVVQFSQGSTGMTRKMLPAKIQLLFDWKSFQLFERWMKKGEIANSKNFRSLRS